MMQTVKYFLFCCRVLFSVTLFIVLPADRLYGSDTCTSINTEVVRDVINYEDEESTLFVRGRFAENIYDTFYFNFSLLRDINEESYDYTWNLQLKEVEDHFDFIAGNYNLNFGSGLIMGKKGYRSSDPFSRSISVTRDESIIPSTGTNPAYSFFGSAMNIFTSGDLCSAGFIPFYSLQRRYASSEDVSRGYISSSLATLSLKTDKTGNNRCSVDIINAGGCISLTLMDLFTVQGYYFKTALEDDSGKRILWEYDSAAKSGVSSAEYCGIFIGYDDEYFSIFIEPAFSTREYEKQVAGRGVMWGVAARNRIMMLSLKGKNCDPGFQAEYSAGDRNPENIFEIKTGVRPADFFETGILFYNEKNLKPAAGRDYLDGIMRQEIFAGLKPVNRIDIDLIIARVKSYKDDLRDEKIKVSSSAVIKADDHLFIRLKSDIQRESSEESYIWALELKYLFFDYFTLAAGFTEIRVADGSSIYAAVIPASDAEMCSSNYTGPARAGALKLIYRKEDLSFHVRGQYVSGTGGKEVTVESSLGFMF